MTATPVLMRDGAEVYRAAFAAGLRPERPITVTEWACKHRIISREGGAEPGPYRVDRTPYMAAIMDALSSTSHWNDVVFIKGAQIGGSEAGNNWVAYAIDRDPGPMMVVQPTVGLAEDYSKQRFAPMIRDTPALTAKIASPKSRDGSNTRMQKAFPGGILFMSGANSAASLSSKPIGKLFLDEIDRYPLDVDGEGCPVALAEKRTATFPRAKRFKCSTPTIAGASKIQDAYDASTKGRYYVPCPHCGEFQVLEWAGVLWERNADGSPIHETVHYVCAGCGEKIREHHKTEMLRRGEWRHENSKAKAIGFHLSALYSPVGWCSWAKLAQEWHEAQGIPEKLIAFVNTALGECYVLPGTEKDAWAQVYAKREVRPIGVVPLRAVLLTAGIDVQKDRIEITIVGWRGKECWIVDHIVIDGDTGLDIDDQKGPWPKLTDIIQRDWPHAGGGTLRIEKAGADSGYISTKVYEWVRSIEGRVVIAVKGDNSGQMTVPISPGKAQEFRTKDGRKIARGIKLYMVGGTVLKREIRARLKLPKPSDEQVAASGYPVNYLHVPELTEDYCRQLTAETEVLKKNRLTGRETTEWHQSGRNEALDCLQYAFAVYYNLGANRWTEKQWDVRVARLADSAAAAGAPVEVPAETPAAAAPAPAARKKPKPTVLNEPPRRSFWDGPDR